MKNIYIAGALDGRVPWTERQRFVEELLSLDEHLREKLPPEEFRIIDFRDCGREEGIAAPDPNSIGIEDFLRAADIVVALCDPPSCGFGTTVGSILEREPDKIALGFFHCALGAIPLEVHLQMAGGRKNQTYFFNYGTFDDISSMICHYGGCFDGAPHEVTVEA